MVLRGNTVEDVLAGRQTIESELGGEVTLGQSVDPHLMQGRLEAVGGCDFKLQPRGAIRTCPHHTRGRRNISRLQAVRQHRAVVGSTQIGRKDTTSGARGSRKGKSADDTATCDRATIRRDHSVASLQVPNGMLRELDDTTMT